MFVHKKHVLLKQYSMLPVYVARHDFKGSGVPDLLKENAVKN